jgi:integrase
MKQAQNTILTMYNDNLIKGGDVKTWTEDIGGVRWYFVDRGYRVPGCKNVKHFRRKTNNSYEHAEQIKQALAINADTVSDSIKYGKCSEIYLKEKGDGKHGPAFYKKSVEVLGRYYPDHPLFASAYAQYCSTLEASGMAVNTVNKYKIVVRTVCNYAYKTSRVRGGLAVRDWGLKTGVSRERILSNWETLAIENKMIKWDSHLLWPFRFAIINPIRKTDLFNLRKEDVKYDIVNGERVWYVQLVQQKTGRKKGVKVTTLPNIPDGFLQYVSGLPSDCPWLFPMVGSERNGMHTKLKPGSWKKIAFSKRHWNNVLTECNIADLHFHDLKHTGETYMYRQGYTYDQIGKLNIQRSDKTKRIYDNRTHLEIVASIKTKQEGLVGNG